MAVFVSGGAGCLVTFLPKDMMRNVLKPCGFLLLVTSCNAYCEEQFDLSLLEKTPGISGIDASYFNEGNDLLPGEYKLKVVVNGEAMGSEAITVSDWQGKVQPLFTCDRLTLWGITAPECPPGGAPLSQFITPSSVDIDLGENLLTITVPQKFWAKPNRYDVARRQDWDNGINAAFSNYSVQYENERLNHGPNQSVMYGTFENGMNLGGFQFRNNGFLSWQDAGKPGYTSSASYIRHDIDSVRGTLTAGDFYTSGIFFSSLSLRGLSLTSNTGMFSAAERNYAPAIVGVAQSNATVVVRQKGYVIATRKVTPGPFTLKDIPASASAGDMQVTVYEANGAQRTFYQPYNSIDMLAPEGVIKYYLYAGKNRQQETDKSTLVEGDAQYGLSNAFTLLGGAQYAENYANLAAGVGANLRYPGAFYALLNGSRRAASAHQTARQGEKIKLGYTKYLAQTQSYLLATLEHKLSTGYREFDDARSDAGGTCYGNYKNKYSLQFSQNTSVGNAVLNYTRQENWNGGASHALRGSLNINLSRYTLIASVGRQKNDDGSHEKIVSLTLSVPLNEEMNHYVTLNHSNSEGHSTDQIAASGSLLEDRQLSYNLNATTTQRSDAQEVDASVAYLSSHGLGSGTFRSSDQGQQFSLGMEGGVIAHHHGVTFSQRLGNSAALIHTDNVQGLKVENNQNVETDAAGNAIAPNLVPYHYNEEALFNESSNLDINVSSDVVTSAPRQGAIVEMNFAARYQQRQFVRVVDAQNRPLPFGTALYDSRGNNVGMVSENGIALAEITEQNLPLQTKGETVNLRCVIENPQRQNETIRRLQCQ